MMKLNQPKQKLFKLQGELEELQKRMAETLKKSHEIFHQRGDGWHDNQSYELMIADVDKIGALIDEVKQEIFMVKKSLTHEKGK